MLRIGNLAAYSCVTLPFVINQMQIETLLSILDTPGGVATMCAPVQVQRLIVVVAVRHAEIRNLATGL